MFAEYCRRHKLGAPSFYLWRSRLAREVSSTGRAKDGFREVLPQERASVSTACTVEISSVRIRLSDERLLRQVLSALDSGPGAGARIIVYSRPRHLAGFVDVFS